MKGIQLLARVVLFTLLFNIFTPFLHIGYATWSGEVFSELYDSWSLDLDDYITATWSSKQNDSDIIEVTNVSELVAYYQSWDISANLDAENKANNATFNKTVKFLAADWVEAILTKGTQITTKNGDWFDLMALGLTENSWDDIDLESYETLAGSTKFGIEWQDLVFSKPVELKIPVSWVNDGEYVSIEVKHATDLDYNDFGLTNNPNAICGPDGSVSHPYEKAPVIQGYVTIYTCWASNFNAIYIGWANAANFVDNGNTDFTTTVTVWNLPAWATIEDVNVLIDFHSVDTNDAVATPDPGQNAYSEELSFTITSPDWTTVNLLNTGDMLTWAGTARVVYTFDDAAGWWVPNIVPSVDWTFQPAWSLATLVWENPFWTWTLNAADTTGQDGMVLYWFTVEINANDAPTDIALSSENIDEQSPSWTTVWTLSTTDPDVWDTHTYSLACASAWADDASFAISGTDLNSAAVFDSVVKSSYDICIRVTDNGWASYDENFTISINSLSVPAPIINNNLPTITSTSTSFSVWVWTTAITTITATDPDSSNVVMQYGTTNVTWSAWSAINHSQMCSPIAVGSSRSDVNGQNQSVVRINNKTASWFQIKVDNQSSSIPGAQVTQVDWIVTNSGAYTFVDDGSTNFQIQAGSQLTSKLYAKACRSGGTPQNTTFSPVFWAAPAVIHTIASNNWPVSVASTVNANNNAFNSEPTTSQMWFMLQKALGLCTAVPAEDIDYIAMARGHYTFGWDEVDILKSGNNVASVTAAGNTVSYGSAFPVIPQTILVALSAWNGSDGWHANVHTQGAVTTTNFPATVDEDDNVAGTNRTHANEIIAGAVFEKNNGVITQPNILTYSISGGADASFFQISSTGWVLSFSWGQNWNDLADANGDATYEVQVQVCDSHCSNGCDTQSITVEVNGAPTDIALSGTWVDEWVAAGTTIGILSTTDINSGDIHSYSFVSWTGDTDNAAFTISGSTLTINASPDFITQSSYDIRIQTDDGRWGTYSETFTILVTDIDNEVPVVTITAPTKLSNASITDTTIVVTDNVWINAADVSISWSGTVSASSLSCTQSWTTIVNCTISIDSTGNLVITADDIAGNTGTDTESGYVIDTVAPNVPSVSVDTDAPNSIDNPEITFSALDNLAVDRFTISYNSDNGTTWIGTWVVLDPATSPVSLILDPDEDVHTIIVTVFDTAGNSASSTVVFPPNVTFSAPTTISGSTITDSTVTINNPSGNDVSNITLTANTTGASLGTCTWSGSDTTAPYNNPATCIINNIATSGTITVSGDDAILGATGMNSQSYIIDTVAPVITITAPTTSSGSAITDTTIRVTDAVWILSANVVIGSGSTTTSSYSCIQTNVSTVDCSVSIDVSWNLVINATDTANNLSSETQTGYVIDTVAPTITLIWSGTINLAQGSFYSDAGAICSDNVDVSCSVTTTWSVDTSISGVYTVSYNAVDAAGNIATTVTRTINVTGAAILINEVEYDPVWNESEWEWFELYNPTASSVNISWWTIAEAWGPSYTFLSGVTIPALWYLLVVNDTTEFWLAYSWVTIDIDMQDSDSPACFNDTECLRLNNGWDSLTLTDAVSTTIDMVEWEQGIWSSISGTAGATVCRTGATDTDLPADWTAECVATPGALNVVDNTPAVITLNGSGTITIEVWSTYTDSWAIFNDNKDGTGPITASGNVNTSGTGTFILTYDYTDNAGNVSTQVTRTVNVVDTTIPVISLNWSGTITLVKNATFTDPWATALDNLDGNITSNIIVNGTVTTSGLGTYTITYNVSDASWNDAVEVTRTVEVVAWDTPVLSLIWSGTVSLELGSSYTDLWATYSDTEDGTGSVVWTWIVNTNILGNYTYTYNFTDSSDNVATAITRTIQVIDTTPPIAPNIATPTPGQLLTNNVPALTGTGEANTVFEVRNGSGVLLWTWTVNGSGNYSFTPGSALPEWSNIFSVNLVDGSGNAGPSSSVTFSVDTMAPVVTITASTKLSNAAITDTTITITDNIWVNAADISIWTWSSATLSGFNCTQSGTTQVNCTISVDDSGTLVINAADTSGNAGSDMEMGYVIDTVAPNVPSISVNTDAPFSVDGPRVTFSALDNVSVAKFTITYNSDDGLGGSIGTWVTIDPATSPLTLALDPDEILHTVTVTVFDTAGNFTSSTIQFPPSVTFNAPTTLSGWIISDSTVTINNPSGNDVSNITLLANTTNATLWTCTGSGSDSTAPYATPVTCIINNITGSGTITVSGDDSVLGATGMNSQSYIIDNEPAVITITAPTKLSWTGIINTTIEVIDNNGILASNVVIGWSTTASTSNYSCTQTNSSTVDCTIQIDDSWNLQITATDNAGNSSSTSENNYIIDTTPAVITLNGSWTITLEIGDSYSDLGAEYNDNIDGTGSLIATEWPVSTSGTGVFTLSYNYTDAAWNVSTTVTRTVNVVDTTPPVITLVWSGAVTVLRNTSYTDSGATYTDNLDPSGSITASGTVDLTTVGIYTLTYDVTDLSWNAAVQVTRTVQIVAGNIPEILFSGSGTIDTEFGLPFVNPGVTGKDIEDGDITASLVSSWTVDTNTLGTYFIEYNLQDSSLNSAPTRIRTVNVVDTTPATITLNWSGSVTLEFGTPYIDLWADYSDLFDGTWSIVASGSVDVNTLWTYILTYDYTDSNGNISSQVTRTVNIVDTTLPVITLNGSGTITLEAGSSYIDAWAIFSDNVDGTWSVTGTGVVNSNVPWNYEITYDYTDSSGNVAVQVTRTVDVVDTTPAIITLIWSGAITLEIGDSYSDAWATFSDIVDGTWSIIATGWPVTTTSTWSFTLSYNYTDTEWNVSTTVTRTVTVLDTTIPVITLSGSGTVTVEAGSSYSDLWASFADNLDGTWSLTASWTVDTTSTWSTMLTYDFTDASWNDAVQVTRTVTVVDTTPAVISLNWSGTIILEIWDSYTDAWAVFSDFIDGTGALLATGWPVNTSGTGVFILSYNYTDSSWNVSTTVTRTVTVVDTTPPVITLNGSGTITINRNDTYTDLGAQFSDNLDGTGSVAASWTVNTAATGSYILTYDYTDASGNAAVQVTRTINVVAGNIPVITLNGSGTITLEIGDSYTDAWATYSDVEDGTGSIVATGWLVTTAWTGSFTLSYSYTDASGNTATTVTRTVTVLDTTIPVINLNGSGTLTVEAGSTYTDLGASFTDNLDGTWSVTASWVVDTSSTGSTVLTYDFTDASGNVAVQVTRTVTVVDTTPANITLNGSGTVNLEIWDSYTDLWAVFSDIIDGTGSIVATGWPVTTTGTWVFTLSYNYTDISGNVSSTVTRTINVVDTTPPVITLVWSGIITHEVGTVYTDSGATALDNLDGNITISIVVVNPVNTASTGSYTITYNVTDASWNNAIQVNRVVNVISSLFDGDGDGVPDLVEIDQWTDPWDILDFRDTDWNGDPDFTDPDNDGDGSLDIVEIAAPNGGDFNGDGLPDIDQVNVATIISSVTGQYVALDSSTAGSCGTNAFAMQAESALASQDILTYPIGLADFELECSNTGATADLKLYLNRVYTTTPWTYKKYNPVLDTYTDISSIVTYSVENVWWTNVTVVSYSITDGWVNDEDGTANRVIIDPSGPGIISTLGSPGWRTYSCRDENATNYRNFWFSKPELCKYDDDVVAIVPENNDTPDNIQWENVDQKDNLDPDLQDNEIDPVKGEDYVIENDFKYCPIITDIQNPIYVYKTSGVFADEDSSAYKQELLKFAAIGIINGYDNGNFGPSNTMTRTEFLKVALISHCYEYRSEDPSDLVYTDVDTTSWQARVIKKAQDLGMINWDKTESGIPIFRPDDVISKAEAVKILMKLSLIEATDPEPLGYNDITVNWHEKYIRTGETLGLFNANRDNNRFNPDAAVKREDMIDLVNRLVQLYK